jgi:succinate-acetate transporter protein
MSTTGVPESDIDRLGETIKASAPVIADPGPLGLAAFAMTTFVLSTVNSNIIPAASPLVLVVLPLALFYGGTAQLLAGMWEFRKGNTFGATAFSSYGAFWLSFAAYVKYIAGGLPAATAHEATGLFLLAWTIFTAYMLVASLRTNLAIIGVFLFLTLTFLALTIGALPNANPSASGWTHLGGWLGLVTAAIAWYTSFAVVTNATWKKQVLPTFPMS